MNYRYAQAFLIILLFQVDMLAQHTFSIVAIDTTTGEIGSAGATCLDDISFPGSGGAIIISDVVPGVGAVHTQSYWLQANQDNAHRLLNEGKSAGELMSWLVNNDAQGNPFIRQYGAVTMDPHVASAGYTGVNCLNEKNHLLGTNYAIQGNILIGNYVLDSMQTRFVETEGRSLCERLMAALQGANIRGADSRCFSEGVSSRSAFIRVARPDDDPEDLWMDLNVPSTPFGIEPIDSLQKLFDAFKNALSVGDKPQMQLVKIFPNPSDGKVVLKRMEGHGEKNYMVRVSDLEGRQILNADWSAHQVEKTLDLPRNASSYLVTVLDSLGRQIIIQKQVFVTTNNH